MATATRTSIRVSPSEPCRADPSRMWCEPPVPGRLPRTRRRRPRAAGPISEAGSRSDPFNILVAEHALLRLQFARALAAARDNGHASSIRRSLETLSESLRRHQRREDLVLYPVCERLFGGKRGAASVLRDDHLALVKQLEVLDRESAMRGRVSLLRLDVLRMEAEDHFSKEERVLFPMTAALLSGTESSDLARRLKASHSA